MTLINQFGHPSISFEEAQFLQPGDRIYYHGWMGSDRIKTLVEIAAINFEPTSSGEPMFYITGGYVRDGNIAGNIGSPEQLGPHDAGFSSYLFQEQYQWFRYKKAPKQRNGFARWIVSSNECLALPTPSPEPISESYSDSVPF